MADYKPRIVDTMLKKKLDAKGAVLIEGPKWCGKTTTAARQSASILYMADPKTAEQNVSMVNLDPGILLRGQTPRLIDEWQVAPKLWDAVRFEVDKRGEPGQFILTGSATPVSREHIRHTGTGRFTRLRMRTMSLYESLESSGSVSLKGLFEAPSFIEGVNEIDIERLAFLTCRGGWPWSIGLDGEAALSQAQDYYDDIVHADIRDDGVGRDEGRVMRLMRSYARNQGSQAPITLLKSDMAANDSCTLDEDTVRSYLAALSRIFVIDDMRAWNPNLRSNTAIRTTDTRYFTDPSIAVAALNLSPSDLINDLNTFGLIFETLCMRDLRVYAESRGGAVYHFRDKADLECDAVVCLRNGSYGLIEVKLGGHHAIDAGAGTLLKLSNKIDTDRMKAPSFMAVLTGLGSYAYKRGDGVYVIPVGCLKD